MFHCTCITQFSLARLLIFAGKLINLSSDSAKDKKTNIFFKNCISPQSVFLDAEKAILTNASRTFGQRAENYLLDFHTKLFFFRKNYVFSKNFLWLQKRQFWQTFATKPEKVRSMSQNNKRKYFFQTFLGNIFHKLKGSSVHIGCIFDSAIVICFWQQAEKIQLDVGQWQKFSLFFFASKCSWGHWKSSFDKPFGELSKNSRKFFAQCPKILKNFLFKEKHLS